MKFTLRNTLRLLIWGALFFCICFGLLYLRQAEQRELDRLHPKLREIRLGLQEWEAAEKKRKSDMVATDQNTAPPVHPITRREEMTPEEQAKFARDFRERFLPAAQKWFRAYEGRIPFPPAEFTLDRFHSRVFNNAYTFMIGDITFGISDTKQGAKVTYLMTRKEAIQMNSLPAPGFAPDLTMPVTREDVIGMVKADSGVQFTPHEVLLKPSAASCALNGGAFADILPQGKDPDNGLNFVISMAFNAEGKIVNYQRTPSF